MNRREFVSALGILPFAARGLAGQSAQAPGAPAPAAPSFPIIDTHITSSTRRGPRERPTRATCRAAANRSRGRSPCRAATKRSSRPFGVVGAIIVEASPRLEDNFWLLDGGERTRSSSGWWDGSIRRTRRFRKNLDRFQQNKLFLGIRQGQLQARPRQARVHGEPEAAGGCGLQPGRRHAAPGNDGNRSARQGARQGAVAAPGDGSPAGRAVRRIAREGADTSTHLKELGKRPQVYIKLSEVVHKSGDKVSTDLNMYKEWLDELWSIFGEDRIMFGSDWPQSERRGVQLVSQRHRRRARVRRDQEPGGDGKGVLEELHEAVPLGAARSEPASDLSAGCRAISDRRTLAATRRAEFRIARVALLMVMDAREIASTSWPTLNGLWMSLPANSPRTPARRRRSSRTAPDFRARRRRPASRCSAGRRES